MKDKITLGKMRRLQQCTAPNGTRAILAVDHRNSLRRALNPEGSEEVPGEDLAAFEQAVVSALGPSASAVLADPEYGAPRVTKPAHSLAQRVWLSLWNKAATKVNQPRVRAGCCRDGVSLNRVDWGRTPSSCWSITIPRLPLLPRLRHWWSAWQPPA